MKSIFYYTLWLMLVIAGVANAQAPAYFNYQAVARDASGTPYANKTIRVQIRILDGSATGNQVFIEIHNNVLTNTYGLFNLAIGSAAIAPNSLASVNWATGAKYIEVSVDPTGSGTPVAIGTAQLLSVPYAIYSNTAGNALSGGSGGASSLIGGTGISISGNTISGLNTSNIWNAGQLQGRDVSTTGPNDGSLLVYQQSQGIWSPSLVGTNLIKGGGGTIVLGDFISGLTISSPAINFTTGTGISINNGVISNTLPDQPVTFVNSATTSITGTYPNFTIVSTPAQARTLSYTVATNTLSILGGNSVTIPLVSSVNDGLMSISQANTLLGLASLTGFDIKTSNPATLSVSRSGSVYTLSVPTTPGGTLNFDQTTSTLSISNGNSIVLPNANASSAGLLSSSDFNTLQNIKGVNVVSGSPNVSISTSSGPVFSVSVSTPTAQTLTISGNNTLGLTGGASSPITINDANGSTSGLMSAGNFATLTTLSTLIGFDIQGVPGNTIVTRSGSLYTISVPSTVAPTYGTIGSSATPALTISNGASVVGVNLNIDIQNVNATNSGLMTSSDFLKLSTLSGITINNGTGISVTGGYPNFTITNTATGTFSQWTTTGSDIFFNGGNVGIGTSSPNAQLSVAGNTAISGNLTIAGLGGSGLRRVGVNNNGELIVVTTGAGLTTDLKSITPAVDIQNGKDAVVGLVPVTISVALATATSDGLLSAADFNKLQTITGASGSFSTLTGLGGSLTVDNTIISNPTIIVSTVSGTNAGVLLPADYTKLQSLQNVSVGGLGITTATGPNGLTYIIPAGGSGTVTTVTGVGPITVATGGTTPIITIATASGVNSGVILPADYTKLQTLQNISVAGIGVITTSGPNGLTYVIPASSSTTSIVGIGLTVTTLPGNTYQITNTYTSSGIGYYAASPGLTVSSTSGAIALDIASVNGFGILSSSEYAKLQGLQNVSVGGFGITTATGPNGLTYIIPAGGSGTVTTVTGVGPISVVTGGTTPIIAIATASGVNSGVILPADYTKLQALQNISVSGIGVTTTSGPNGLTYVIPAASSNTTSIVGIGLTVTTLPGNTYQITNTYTSAGVGYYAASAGLTVNSTTGSISLVVASVSGFGILSSSEYLKLQTLSGVSITAGNNISITTALGGLYTISGIATAGTFTTVTGTLPVSVNNTNPQQPIISVNLATSTSAGLLSASDFNKLQTITGASGSFSTLTGLGGSLTVDNTIISNPTIIVSTVSGTNAGVLLPADYSKLQGLQNVSVSGLGVTTTVGPNGLTYIIPAGGSSTVTTVTGVGPISVATGGTTPIITIATASGVNSGVILPADYTKLQALQNISVSGIGVTTTSGPNGLTYVISASSSNTTSIIGIGLTVTTLSGNTYQITNTFTSSGIGYYTTSPGLAVSSTTGLIGLNLNQTSVVGTGVSLISTIGGFSTYSISGVAGTQTLSLVGNNLSISGGNFVTLPSVSIAGLGTVSVTGTYPNFTILGLNTTSTSPGGTLQAFSFGDPNILSPASGSIASYWNSINYAYPPVTPLTQEFSSGITADPTGYGITITSPGAYLLIGYIEDHYNPSFYDYEELQAGIVDNASGNVVLNGNISFMDKTQAASFSNSYVASQVVGLVNAGLGASYTLKAFGENISGGQIGRFEAYKLTGGGNLTVNSSGSSGTTTTVTGVGGSIQVGGTATNPVISVSTVSGTNAGVLLPADYSKLQSLQNVSVGGFGVTTTTGPNGLTYIIPAAGSGTVTTVTGVGPISVATGGTTPVITVATASGTNSGVILPTDYTKLQALQNISVSGIGVTTTTGPNGLTYVIPSSSLNTTSVVGVGVSLLSSVGGITTYSIGGIASQWTTTGLNDIYFTGGKVGINTSAPNANFSVIGNASISGGIVTSALKLTTLSTGGVRWVGVDAIGNVILLPTLNTTSAGLSINSVTGSINLVSSNSSSFTTTTPGLIISTTLGTININTANNTGNGLLSFTDWTTFNNKLSAVTLSGANGISISPSSIGSNFVITGSGQTSIVGLNVSTTSGPTGFTTYSIGGVSSSLTSITGLGLASITGGPGNYSITGIAQTLSLVGNSLSLSNSVGSVKLPITTLVGSGIVSVTNTATGLTTYTVAGISQWVSTTNGIYYPNYVGIGTLNPSSALDLVANDAVNPGVSIINFGGDGLYIASTGTGLNIDSEINGIYVTANTGYGISVQTNSVGSYGIQSTATSSGTAIWGIGSGTSAVGIQGSIFSGSTGNSGYFDNQESTNPYPTVYINTASTVPGLQISSPVNGIGIELITGDLQIDNFSSFAGYTVTVDGNGVFHPAPYGGGSSQWINDAFGINYNGGNIAIGKTSNGTNQFSIVNDNVASLTGTNLSIINYNNSPSFGSAISLAHVMGPASSPQNYGGGEVLGEISFDGYYGGSLYAVAGVKGTVPNKWNNISYNSGLEFYTTPVGSVTPVTAFSVGAASQLNLSSIVQPSGGNTKVGDLYSDGTSLYYYNGVWNDLLSGGANPWTTLGGFIYANYGTSISGISTVGGFNIQNITGVTGAVALGINPSTGVIGTIPGASLVSTSVVGLGVTLITSPGLNTYSIAGTSSISQWTTSGTNILATYNTSISGISSVAGLNLRSISSVSGSYLGVNSSGVVGTISGPVFSITSVSGFGITSSTVGNVTTYTVNQTSVVGLNVSTTSGPNGFTTYSIGGLSSNFTTLTGLALASVTGGLGNYTITGLYPTLTLNGANLSVLGSGLPVVSLPLASVVGLNVSTVTGPTGFTTYSISGGNLINPWSTATGFIYALNNTSISGISSVAGLNIRTITSVSGALLGVNSNGVVGTIPGVASQWSPSLSTTPGIYYNAGNVGIGTSTPNKYAALDISSNTTGILLPRLTSVQRTTLGLNFGAAEDGMLVYDTDLKNFISYFYTNSTSFGWGGTGGGNNNSNYGNVAWNYNSTGTGLVTLNPIYSGVILSTTVAGTTLLTVNGGQLNTSTITTNGLNLSNLTGAGTRFAQVDAAGNLTVTTLGGFVTGSNSNSNSGVAFFTGAGSTITTNPSFVWDNVNSKLGIGTATPQSALDVNYAGTASGISVFLQNSTGSQAALVAKVSGSSAQSTALYTESSISGANIIMANRDPNTTLFKVTTSGQVQIGILTGTGTRFVQADAAGNLSATTLGGFVQGTNTSTATSLAFFTGLNSSVTGTNNLTWNNASSTLGVNGNISLTTPNAGGAGGAVLVQMFTPVAIATGAIVIVDPTTDNQIVTSNQQGSTSAVGVIVGTCNASSYCNVAISGVVKVQTSTAIRGQHCITSTTAGFADSIPSPDPGSSIGVYISNASGGFANVLLK